MAPRQQGWHTSADPAWMLRALTGHGSDRKWRLLCCACFRRLYGPRVQDPRTSAAVEVAERYAEDLANKQELVAARREARRANEPSFHVKRAAWWTTYGRPRPAVRSLLRAEYPPAWVRRLNQSPGRPRRPLSGAEEAQVCALIRELFADPFRRPTFDPSWLRWNEGIVLKIAQGIHDDRAFERLPVLADALEDAGCTDEVILGHCRRRPGHLRGCWVLDGLLGRE
jgi:hypothetical protein